MIFTIENTVAKGMRVVVMDARGQEIADVVRYNSDTREVDVHVRTTSQMNLSRSFRVAVDEQGEPLTARAVALGSKITVDGVEY